MVKVFEAPDVNHITRAQLVLNNGDLSGDLIEGGTIKQFSSTGITDQASRQTITVQDDRITVKADVKIFGAIDAAEIRTTELYVHRKYDSQFLEFTSPSGETVGTGLLWAGGTHNKQLVFRDNPDRFFLTESVDIPSTQSFMIESNPVLTIDALGRTVVNSNLQTVGTLRTLTVGGKVNFNDYVFFNPVSERFSIGTDDANGRLTVYDQDQDVELVFSSNARGKGIIGTYNTKGLDLVTDNQSRITIEVNGDIVLGQEQKDGTTTRIYGKLGVGVKNPREQLEVAGNIRWANKLFAVGNGIPVDGHYQYGDIVWNSNPKEQNYIGWVCTIGGNPGQWRPFGLIN
jgi:hypothetical protein